MITIANCSNLEEATQMKMLLESAGIAAFIPDEASAGMAPFQFMNPTGVRLQVAEEHAESAREVISSGQDNLPKPE
jgi:hypothetical protein